MARRCRQVSAEERVKIETLAAEGHSRNSISRCLVYAQSTISREIERNRNEGQPYEAARAQAFAQTGDDRLGVLQGVLAAGLEPEADRGAREAGGLSGGERDLALRVGPGAARQRRLDVPANSPAG